MRSLLSSDRSLSRDRSRRARRELREGVETVAVSQAPIVSEASAPVAPPVGWCVCGGGEGSTLAVLPPAVQDLTKFFLSLAGSSSQGAVLGAAGASVPASGVGVQLCPRLRVEEQSLLVLRCRLLWQLDLLPLPLLCLVCPADCSVRKRSPVRADTAVARPVVGPAELVRDNLGNAPLPLFTLLAAGRLPIDLLLVLLKKIELSRLLPPLDVCLEVHPAIPVPLRQVTARLVLALRAGGHSLPLQRIGIAQALAVICPPLLRVRLMMTDLVPPIPWTLTGITLSGLSWPSSGTSIACTISLMQDFSCIDLWVDVGDLSGIPPAYLSLATVASERH